MRSYLRQTIRQLSLRSSARTLTSTCKQPCGYCCFRRHHPPDRKWALAVSSPSYIICMSINQTASTWCTLPLRQSLPCDRLLLPQGAHLSGCPHPGQSQKPAEATPASAAIAPVHKYLSKSMCGKSKRYKALKLSLIEWEKDMSAILCEVVQNMVASEFQARQRRGPPLSVLNALT